MKVKVYSISDQLNKLSIKERTRGINDDGKNATDWINAHQEWRGGERYELCAKDSQIKFIWDVNEAEFKHIINATEDDNGLDITEYDGAVFFGNYKLEFLVNDVCGLFNNLFKLGADDSIYDWLEDGTPYSELYSEDLEIDIPNSTMTFDKFTENVETQIIAMLNKYPEMIDDALVDTVPERWYPLEREKYMRDFTKED